MNTLELASHNPAAFAALPKCYQADDVLHFWYSSTGTLYSTDYLHARPAKGQEHILGEWEAIFDHDTGEWEALKPSKRKR